MVTVKLISLVARVVDRVAGAVSSLSTALSTLAVLWLMASTVVHVVLRANGQPGIAGIVETNALVMVGVVFLGIADAQRTGSHVSVRLLVAKMPARVQAVLSAVGIAVAAVFVTWMAFATLDEAIISLTSGERLSGVRPLLVWPAKAVVVFGLAGLLLELVNSLLKQLTATEEVQLSEPVDALPER